MVERSSRSAALSSALYRLFIWGGGICVLVYMIGPILMALAMSFTSGRTLSFPPQGFSLQWYASLFDPVRSGPIHTAALNSLKVAGSTVVLVTLLTAPAAWAMARAPRRFAAVSEPVLLSPLVLPSLVYSLAALLALSLIGFGPSFWAVLIGHTAVFAPLMFRTVLGLAQQQNPALEEASATMGASRTRTFLRVSLPGIMPGVVSGAFLVFMQSFDNVSVTLFLGSPGQTMLPMRLFAMLEESLDGRVAAVSGLLILFAALLLVILQKLGGRSPR